uniref:Protein YIPF n=2 Tax=Trichuris muris TaxID=70415 RepID=A0A5S6QLD0_TRIMR
MASPNLDFLPQLSVDAKPRMEGDIHGTNVVDSCRSDSDFYTLDEPVWETVKRDLQSVWIKLSCVVFPQSNQKLLRNWDLWGPLFICIFIALMLHSNSNSSAQPKFTEAFFIVWVGSFVVTLNIKLLGGTISVFQTLCILGYCLLPLAIDVLICKIASLSQGGTVSLLVRLLATISTVAWSQYAATTFLSSSYPERRKGLSLYPVWFFYVVVAWLILSYTHYSQ